MSAPIDDGGVPQSRPFLPADHPSFQLPPRPERAAWGYRAGAGLIDVAISIAPGLLIDNEQIGGPDSVLPGVWILGSWFLNFVVLASRNGGRSVGKLVAGTRVESDRLGGRYTFGEAFMRDIVCRLMYLIPVFFVIDALMPLGAKRQSLRDKMVDTVVLKESGDRSHRAPLAIVAFLAAAAIGGVSYGVGIFDGDYSDNDRAQFVDDCQEEGGSRAGCRCAWDHITSNLSYGDYLQADRQDPEDMDPRVRQIIQEAFETCPE